MCTQKSFRNFFLPFITLCILLSSGCQREKEAAIEEHDLSPMFLLPPHNLERFEAAHYFYYKNDTEEDVILSTQGSSCSCARVKIAPEKIAPGETATISISYDLAYAQSSRSETVIINTNHEPPKQLAYRLKATTFPRLEIMRTDRNEIVCDPGKSKTLTVLCRAFRPKSEDNSDAMNLFSLSDLLIVHPPSAADSETLIGDVIVTQGERTLEVRSPSPSDSEYDFNGYFATIILENSEHWVELPIRWKPSLYIDADKTSVFFNCTIDPIENERVTLTSKDEFSIIAVQTENEQCEVHYDPQRRSNQHQAAVSVNVELTPESPSASKDTIILFTDHPLQPQIRINVNFLLPFRE